MSFFDFLNSNVVSDALKSVLSDKFDETEFTQLASDYISHNVVQGDTADSFIDRELGTIMDKFGVPEDSEIHGVIEDYAKHLIQKEFENS